MLRKCEIYLNDYWKSNKLHQILFVEITKIMATSAFYNHMQEKYIKMVKKHIYITWKIVVRKFDYKFWKYTKTLEREWILW